MKTNLNLALSLSGGAARGAYQIGVWQALYENGFQDNIKVATGASVGAINAALIAQGDLPKALDLWRNSQPEEAFDQLHEKPEEGYLGLVKDGFLHRGIRVNGLKKLLRTALNEQEIRNSKIEFGLVIYNLTKFRGESLFQEDIPKELLVEYIIGSASFPAFQSHQIGQNKYIDGGLYKIMPVDMTFQKPNIDLLIGIDVAEASKFLPLLWGMKRKYGERLLYLRPSRTLPNPVNFSAEARELQLEIGYEDGLQLLKKIASQS
jgi:NTE family protein